MSPAAAETVTAAGAGRKPLDRQAFQQVYENVAPALRSYARRTTGSEDIANDIVQEAFLRILRRHLPPTSGPELKSYLFKTATSLMNDYWRRIAREQRWRKIISFGRQTHHPPVESGIFGQFQKLKPRERALLWLAYVEGYSHEKIAGVLDVAATSVRVLLFRARRRMAALLAEENAAREVEG